MSKYEAAGSVIVGLLFHVPQCLASFWLFEAGHHWLAVYLLVVSSVLAAKSLLAPFRQLVDEGKEGVE